jgi:hypothetical protein
MAGGRCRILVIEDDCETVEQIVESLAASASILLSTATTDRAADALPNMP